MRISASRIVISISIFLLPPMAAWAQAPLRIDHVLIVDGTGAKAVPGSVRIVEGRIAEVGKLAPRSGEEAIDGGGRVLAPGFIDSHSHHDGAMFEEPRLEAVTSQGVTTIVVGQDGFSETPVSGLFGRLRERPVAVNVATYSGHNTLRKLAMGTDGRRPATSEDVKAMSDLLEDDMASGAFGLSTGLMYETGAFSKPQEVLDLAKVSARHGGRYISHMRNEGVDMLPAIDEVIEIGRQTRMPVQVSHLKIGVKKLWGQSDEVLRKLEAARAEGIDITADIYPYTYWQTTLRVLFAKKDYEDRDDLAFSFAEAVPPDKLIVPLFKPDPSIQGKTIAEIAKERGKDPVTLYIELVRQVLAYEKVHAGEDGIGRVETVIGTSMDETDVEAFLKWRHANVCSDGFNEGHPRGHGTFTRVLGRYVRERKALTLEEAVHKMSGLTAQHLGIADRGTIRPGMWADLVLFDPATVNDRATIQDPKALSVGIAGVWVNGQRVFADGHALDRYPGAIVKRPGTPQSASDPALSTVRPQPSSAAASRLRPSQDHHHHEM